MFNFNENWNVLTSFSETADQTSPIVTDIHTQASQSPATYLLHWLLDITSLNFLTNNYMLKNSGRNYFAFSL
jgi:hypothetical protein